MNSTKKPIEPRGTIAQKVAEIYFMVKPEEIAHAVYDYCRDLRIELSFLRFKATCYTISLETGIMQPSSSDVRHYFDLLQDDLKTTGEIIRQTKGEK
jgi:hypothetical protein